MTNVRPPYLSQGCVPALIICKWPPWKAKEGRSLYGGHWEDEPCWGEESGVVFCSLCRGSVEPLYLCQTLPFCFNYPVSMIQVCVRVLRWLGGSLVGSSSAARSSHRSYWFVLGAQNRPSMFLINGRARFKQLPQLMLVCFCCHRPYGASDRLNASSEKLVWTCWAESQFYVAEGFNGMFSSAGVLTFAVTEKTKMQGGWHLTLDATAFSSTGKNKKNHLSKKHRICEGWRWIPKVSRGEKYSLCQKAALWCLFGSVYQPWLSWVILTSDMKQFEIMNMIIFSRNAPILHKLII